MLKSSQLSVEVRMNKNTMAKELINVNKDCHCVTYVWWKNMVVISLTNPVWSLWTTGRK